MVLVFLSLDQTMQCDYSLESYGAEQYFLTVLFILQCSVVLTVYQTMQCDNPFFGKLLNSTFMLCCLFCDTVWF